MTGNGGANLQALLRNVPVRPGVYLMKDAAGAVIYVGKAAALKNRVRSYFQKSAEPSAPKPATWFAASPTSTGF